MGGSLEAKIKRLQQFYWSDDDPEGRGFVCLADAFRRTGDFAEALRLLRDGLRRHPDLSSGFVVRGWVYADQGDASDAEDAFRAAVALDPENVAALQGLADALAARGDVREALECLRKLAPLDPLNGDLPQRVGELEAALEAEVPAESAEEEPEEEPIQPRVWEDPDAVAEELDWTSAALQDDESRATEAPAEPGTAAYVAPPPAGSPDPRPRAPGRGDALVTGTMGDIFLRQGLLDEAEDVYRQLLEGDPENREIRNKLAEVERRRRGEFSPEPSPFGAVGTAHSVGPVVPIQELLVDEIVAIEELAPDSIVSIQELAPDVIVPVEALAPDDSRGAGALDAFEAWLDDLP